MAAKLDMSPSYLSSVETGAKPVPPKLVSKLISSYELRDAEVVRLRKLAALHSKEYHLVPKEDDLVLVGLFAQMVEDLSPASKQELEKFLWNQK